MNDNRKPQPFEPDTDFQRMQCCPNCEAPLNEIGMAVAFCVNCGTVPRYVIIGTDHGRENVDRSLQRAGGPGHGEKPIPGPQPKPLGGVVSGLRPREVDERNGLGGPGYAFGGSRS